MRFIACSKFVFPQVDHGDFVLSRLLVQMDSGGVQQKQRALGSIADAGFHNIEVFIP